MLIKVVYAERIPGQWQRLASNSSGTDVEQVRVPAALSQNGRRSSSPDLGYQEPRRGPLEEDLRAGYDALQLDLQDVIDEMDALGAGGVGLGSPARAG